MVHVWQPGRFPPSPQTFLMCSACTHQSSSSTVATPDCTTLLMGPSMILTTFLTWSPSVPSGKNCTILLHCIKEQNHTSKLTTQTPDLFPSHTNLHRHKHWIAQNIRYHSLLPLLSGSLNNILNGFSNFVTHIGFQSTVAALLSVAAISAAGLGTENKSLPGIAHPITQHALIRYADNP